MPHPLARAQGPEAPFHLSTAKKRYSETKNGVMEKQVRKTPFPSPLLCLPLTTVKEARKVPPEIASSLRRLIITHNDHSTIHFALKLIHHVENDIALIYHKIYETCTFSNEIYANAALDTVCVLKSFDKEMGVQPGWLRHCPHPGDQGERLHGGSCPWRGPGEQAPWPSQAHPVVPSLPGYTLLPLEPALPVGAPAASGGETITGGGIASPGEQGSLSPNQRPSGTPSHSPGYETRETHRKQNSRWRSLPGADPILVQVSECPLTFCALGASPASPQAPTLP